MTIAVVVTNSNKSLRDFGRFRDPSPRKHQDTTRGSQASSATETQGSNGRFQASSVQYFRCLRAASAGYVVASGHLLNLFCARIPSRPLAERYLSLSAHSSFRLSGRGLAPLTPFASGPTHLH
jgi:hypothetical protein